MTEPRLTDAELAERVDCARKLVAAAARDLTASFDPFLGYARAVVQLTDDLAACQRELRERDAWTVVKEKHRILDWTPGRTVCACGAEFDAPYDRSKHIEHQRKMARALAAAPTPERAGE